MALRTPWGQLGRGWDGVGGLQGGRTAPWSPRVGCGVKCAALGGGRGMVAEGLEEPRGLVCPSCTSSSSGDSHIPTPARQSTRMCGLCGTKPRPQGLCLALAIWGRALTAPRQETCSGFVGVCFPKTTKPCLHQGALPLINPWGAEGQGAGGQPPPAPSEHPPPRRRGAQVGERRHHQVPHRFPPDPLAPLRPALLLLRDDGQGAGEVGGGFPGLRAALQQR